MHLFRMSVVSLATCLALTTSIRGELVTKAIEYRDGDVILQGYAAWDSERTSAELPGVLVVHQWMGLTDYE